MQSYSTTLVVSTMGILFEKIMFTKMCVLCLGIHQQLQVSIVNACCHLAWRREETGSEVCNK